MRKRRLPLETVLWSIIGMALYRQKSVWDIATQMDIMLPDKKPLVAPSALVQARQRLGADAVKEVFKAVAQHGYETNSFEQWAGLNLFAVDGVVWRAADTLENHQVFETQSNQHRENTYPQIRMVCHMELTSHLLCYNLIRLGMTAAAKKLDSVWPNQLSFTSCSMAITQFFATLPLTSPGNIPKHYESLLEQMSYFKLPPRREDRTYPRWVKPKPRKYPHKKNKLASP
ncbi:hypothetical protein VR7878_03880 [Vibrio ruber DSM 16370]|uniref:Transposase IS4 N-terminal domain-containing protein n=1 Tax=Vibrio ruber (strain DSM 16370 / JCM 11486 / BCRC 17186 / CECT 7878 / LMG 23124 / VR1) TaxID=1123498 RepID=A0A1R4LTR8_VIBR1|nr:hypothetical protein VR7878_03880 [Vibrio ruber DSM 16370]